MKTTLQLLLTTVIVFSFSYVMAQPPVIQWQKSLGGGGNDIPYVIQQTADGGYIIVGWSSSSDGDATGSGLHGSYDYWVVKTDNVGTVQWQKAYGGINDDYAYSIKQTIDGGYIVAGFSTSNDGDVTGHHGTTAQYDYWIVKLNDTGTIKWQKSLGGTGGEIAYSIQQTADSGYIVAGFVGSTDGDVTGNHGGTDYWVVKLDSAGTIRWQKCLGGSGIGASFAYAIRQTTDGGYIVAGKSSSTDGDVTGNHGGYDYWVVKLDGIGTIEWQKSLGGTNDDDARDIRQTIDGGYIIAGFSNSNDGDVTGHHGTTAQSDYWIVKLDSVGTIQWQKSLGGTTTDQAYAIQQITDGGYIVAGTVVSADGDVTGHHGTTTNADYWIVKLDTIGNIEWQKTFGGTADDEATYVQQIRDGEYVVIGYSNSTDGDVTGNHGKNDYWIVKLGPDVATGIKKVNETSPFTLYPNPAGKQLTVTGKQLAASNIEIIDLLGRTCYSETTNNQRQTTINVSNLAPGIYMLQVKGDDEVTVKKFLKE